MQNKKCFTLVEVLIAMAIGGVILGMTSNVLFEYQSAYEDMIADCYLTSFAQQLKIRVERGYPDGGLREAVVETVKENLSADQKLEFKTFSGLDKAYSASIDDPGAGMLTQLKFAANQFVISYNGKNKNGDRGKLVITDVSSLYIDRKVEETDNVKLIHMDEKLVSLIYTIEYTRRNKKYEYKLKVEVPIINEDESEG